MVTKGYILNVYDEDGKTLVDPATNLVTDPTAATQADVWLPVFDDTKVLGPNSTIGRAEMAVLPHTKIPLQIQYPEMKSAVLCAIQDFDLSTLLIIGYLNNRNNDKLAPYATMELSQLTTRDKTILKGDTSLLVTEEGRERLNIPVDITEESYYVTQKDFETLYDAGDTIGNISKSFSNLETLIENVASATGIYSISYNTTATNCILDFNIDLRMFQNIVNDTYDVVYALTYQKAIEGKWRVVKNNVENIGSYTTEDLGIDMTLKGSLSEPYVGSAVYIVFNSAVPVTSGGTGGTTPAEARNNLEIPTTYIMGKDEFSGVSEVQPNSIFYLYG